MTYKEFKKQCQPGIIVTDGERTGTVIKISKDLQKALVKYSDGYIEWSHFYQIELV